MHEENFDKDVWHNQSPDNDCVCDNYLCPLCRASFERGQLSEDQERAGEMLNGSDEVRIDGRFFRSEDTKDNDGNPELISNDDEEEKHVANLRHVTKVKGCNIYMEDWDGNKTTLTVENYEE